jgi:hypothetical protein
MIWLFKAFDACSIKSFLKATFSFRPLALALAFLEDFLTAVLATGSGVASSVAVSFASAATFCSSEAATFCSSAASLAPSVAFSIPSVAHLMASVLA